jgi:fructuronate reductase
MRFVRTKAISGEAITDPLADDLIAIGKACQDDQSDVSRFLALRAVFPEALATDATVITGLEGAYRELLLNERQKTEA